MPWRPITGDKARRYRNDRSGRVISRRQYDNMRARDAGFRNMYDVEQTREELQGSNWLADIYGHTRRRPTFDDYHNIREVKERRAALRDTYGDLPSSELDQYDDELTAPDGPLAQLLDAAGRRPMSGRPVGGS